MQSVHSKRILRLGKTKILYFTTHMNQHILTRQQARKIILHAAGLDRPAPFGTGREAVYQVIDHLGYVQIDTNYVVERAHHHAIATRVPDYEIEWLNELQEEGLIYEYLTSDSGYMPMHEVRFSLPTKESFRVKNESLTRAEINLMKSILDRIGREGPLMVTDFENDRMKASSGWWDWRPAKVALERLYRDGRLMTTRAKDFKKRYDLPGNLIPADVDLTMPTPEEFARHVIKRNLKALGIAYAKELNWRARFVKNNLIKQELPKLVEEGEICAVAVEGLKSAILYMLPVYKDKNIELSGDAFILSPFDTLNVFRHRLRDFFDFDYQIECFVPEAKRKYGYFSLPILIGEAFVARMDAKADRKTRILIVHNLHFESLELNEHDLLKLTEAIKRLVLFNQCRDIKISKSNNEQYLEAIKQGLE